MVVKSTYLVETKIALVNAYTICSNYWQKPEHHRGVCINSQEHEANHC